MAATDYAQLNKIDSTDSLTFISKNKKSKTIEKNSTLTNFFRNYILYILEKDRKNQNPVFLYFDENIIDKFVFGVIARPVSIGLAGESASGKSTFVHDIITSIINYQTENNLSHLVTRLNADDYYYDRSEDVKKAGGFENFAQSYDFDVPDAIELSLLKEHIEKLMLGQSVFLPKYSMDDKAVRTENHKLVNPCKFIISEGLFNLNEDINYIFDLKIYVDISNSKQKMRWFKRASERYLTGEAAVKTYNNVIKNAQTHVKPTMRFADIIINGNADRESYINIINKFIELSELANLCIY